MNLRWPTFERPLRTRLEPFEQVASFFGFFVTILNSGFEDIPRWLLMTFRGCATVAFLSFCRAIDVMPSEHSLASVILAATDLWALMLFWARMNYCLDLAQYDAVHRVLGMLPIAPSSVFKRFFGQIAFGHFCLFLEFAFVYCIVLSERAATPFPLAIGLLFAVAQTAFSLGLTLLMLRWKVKGEWLFFATLFFCFTVAVARTALPYSGFTASTFMLCDPLAFVGIVLTEGWLGHKVWGWFFTVPVLAVLLTLPASFRTFLQQVLRGEYRRFAPQRQQALRSPKVNPFCRRRRDRHSRMGLGNERCSTPTSTVCIFRKRHHGWNGSCRPFSSLEK